MPARKEPKGKAVLRSAFPKSINTIPTAAAVQMENSIDRNPKG